MHGFSLNSTVLTILQPNQDLFEQQFQDISNPDSANYGKHFTRDELKALLRPSNEASRAVINWLKASGVQDADIEDDGEWIKFAADINQVEAMLDTKFNLYQSIVKPSISKIRTLQYSLPQELLQYIDLVTPTTRFAQIKPQGNEVHDKEIIGDIATIASAVNDTACNVTITPTCLRDLYNIKGFTPNPKQCGFIGVSGFLEQYAQYGDLAQWQPTYAPWATEANFTWTSINGKSSLTSGLF